MYFVRTHHLINGQDCMVVADLLTNDYKIKNLDDVELNAELEKGFSDIKAGRTKDAKGVFDEIRRDYGV